MQGEDYSLGGVDLDTCRDPATGGIEPWATEVIARVGSYAEVSPSGTGVKLFLLYATADLPSLRGAMGTEHGRQFKCGTGKHPPAIEMHFSNRFFAVTDQHLKGTPVELRQVDKQTLLWILTQAGPALIRSGAGQIKSDGRPSAAASATAASGRVRGEHLAQSADAAVLARLQEAMRQRPKLAARWNGSMDGLQDTSRSGMDMSVTALLKQAQFSFSLSGCRSGQTPKLPTGSRLICIGASARSCFAGNSGFTERRTGALLMKRRSGWQRLATTAPSSRRSTERYPGSPSIRPASTASSPACVPA